MDGNLSHFPPQLGDDPMLAALRTALQRRNVTLRGVQPCTGFERALAALARRIGEHHAELRPLLDRAKASTNARYRHQTLKLADRPGPAIGRIVQMARDFHQYGMLARQHYRGAPDKVLHITGNAQPQAHRFLTGGWLEFYAFDVARTAAAEVGLAPGAVFCRAEVTLPPGDPFDLDLCLLHPEHGLVWVETKIGRNYNDKLDKYAHVARQLGLDATRAILLCPEFAAADDVAVVMGGMAGMTATGLEGFPAVLRQALARRAEAA